MSGARQESIPDPPGSEPAQLIDSGALYQPAPLAGRLGLATVVGACVSYLTTKVPVELFPARSVQLPLTDVPFVSGPLYGSAESQDAIPEVASLPCQPTERGALNQPFALGAGVGEAWVVGGVESYLRRTSSEELFPALSVQLPVTVVPLVSGPLKSSWGRHEAIPEPPVSEPLQVIESGLRYQAAAFGGRLTLATLVGACVSYLTMNGSEELLPAMSVHVPLTLVPFVSGPL